jgi:hypothetical protein|tara:strand:+ start:1820 stop:2398 length:579 start_codon:yes stop_codon:yes gene_type:complete
MVLAGLAGHAQIPVTDAAAGASLTAINAQITTGNMTLQELVSIQTAAKGEAVNTQTNTLNTLKQAEKMYEIYTKINNAITTAKLVDEIWDTSKNMIQLTFDVHRIVNSSNLDGDVKRTLINTGTDLLNRAEALLEIVNKILESGTLKGDDMDRINALMDIKEQLDKQYTDLQAYSFNCIEMNGLSSESMAKN